MFLLKDFILCWCLPIWACSTFLLATAVSCCTVGLYSLFLSAHRINGTNSSFQVLWHHYTVSRSSQSSRSDSLFLDITRNKRVGCWLFFLLAVDNSLEKVTLSRVPPTCVRPLPTVQWGFEIKNLKEVHNLGPRSLCKTAIEFHTDLDQLSIYPAIFPKFM